MLAYALIDCPFSDNTEYVTIAIRDKLLVIVEKMGCKACRPDSSSDSSILFRIKDYIERDDPSNLSHFFRLLSQESKKDISELLNENLFRLKSFSLNPLAYSLLLGRTQVYTYLTSSLGASVQSMEDSFESANICVIFLLCEKGHFEILKLYLPTYLQSYSVQKQNHNQTSTLSLTVTHTNVKTVPSTYTPIQIACEMGFVNIVHYLHEYFQENVPPFELDVHHIDESTGENCALISARNGNFVMMKVLHEVAQADFNVKNKNQEGALQVIAASTRTNGALQYLECIMYLVEVIRIDITYNHEETLLLLENKIIIKYIEDKLKFNGVLTSKREIETIYRIRGYNAPKERTEKEDLKGDSAEISGIYAGSNVTAFSGSSCLNFNIISK